MQLEIDVLISFHPPHEFKFTLQDASYIQTNSQNSHVDHFLVALSFLKKSLDSS
jgi:hypothetical protein